MKRFLISGAVFTAIIMISFYAVFSLANGYTDTFYIRFTTPKQTSLILGSSRAAQGIQPKILNKKLSRKDIFNYSFTNSHSPYGPAYLGSIKRKLDTESKDGIFILAIDPWGISSRSKHPDDITQFREDDLAIANTYFVNTNPNPFYLINNYGQRYINLILKRNKKTSVFVHNDGWLEVFVNIDSVAAEKRIKSRIPDIRENDLPIYKFSKVRYAYLIKTIEFLKNHGSVYLVRLPIHPSMMDIERALMPDFDGKATQAAKKTKVIYLDMTVLNSECRYLDGVHVFKSSGKRVTEIIGDWILSRKGQRPGEFEINLDRQSCG